jgi:hypothetical protein
MNILSANTVAILCSVDILCLLNCITETIQVTEGRKYFPREPYVGQPCFKMMGLKDASPLFYVYASLSQILFLLQTVARLSV